MSPGSSLFRALIEGLVSALSQRGGARPGKTTRSSNTAPERTSGAPTAKWRSQTHAAPQGDSSPGQMGRDATRDLTPAELSSMAPSYAPKLDGEPDPGEVIWTWVPYAENDGRGKDRPVLIIARLNSESWAGCYLSTKYHDDFVSVGSGSWDSQGRESFLSPERVLRVTEAGMRRESTGIDESRFRAAVLAVLRWHKLTQQRF